LYNDLKTKGKTFEAYEKCKTTITFYNGLNDLKLFFEEYKKYKTDTIIDIELQREEAIWKFEEKEIAKYMEAFQKSDLNWWKKSITEVNTRIKT